MIRRHARSTCITRDQSPRAEHMRRNCPPEISTNFVVLFLRALRERVSCEDPMSSRTEALVALFRLALLTMAACGVKASVFVERESWPAFRKVPSFSLR